MALARGSLVQRLAEKACRRGILRRFPLFMCYMLLGVTSQAKAEFCGYVSDGAGGTLTAVDLPAARFRYRIPVVPAWYFAATSCAASEARQALWCGVAQIYHLPSEEITLHGGATAPPGSAVVVDLPRARQSGRLPFPAWHVVLAGGGSLLVSSHSDPVLLLYDLTAASVSGVVGMPGRIGALADSPGGERVYVTYSTIEAPGGFHHGFGVVDVSARALLASLELPRAARPDLEYPYLIVGVDASDQAYVVRRGETRLEVVDGRRGQHTMSIPLLGEPLALAHPHAGPAVYVRHRGESDDRVSLVSLPEGRVLATRSSPQPVSALDVSPDGEWVVASLPQQLAVWSADLSVERGRTDATSSSDGVTIVRGWCPDAEPCVGDCNADGTVTVDEVMAAANAALELLPTGRCFAAEANGDRRITVEELIRAAGSLLFGCG